MKLGILAVAFHAAICVSMSASLLSPRLLLSPLSFSARSDSNDSCSQIANIPQDSQCQFVLDHCSGEDYFIGRINYLSVYYCRLSWLLVFSSLPLLGALSIFFISLGLTASDYLCPNLYTISKFLKLSDNLSGLTLLALGNGSPDVLSTFKAMSFGSGSLAISELMGASLFVTTVVIGCIAIVHPLKVPRRLFVRDTIFYLMIACLLIFTLVRQSLTLPISIILVSSYVLYVGAVVLDHSYLKRQITKRLRSERSRANFTLQSDSANGVLNDNEEIDDIYLDTFANLPTIEELNLDHRNMEFVEEVDTILRVKPPTAADSMVRTGSYGLKLLVKELQKHSHLHGDIQLESERPLTAPNPVDSSSLPDDIESGPTSSSAPGRLGSEPRHNLTTAQSWYEETQEIDSELHDMLRFTSTINWWNYLRRKDSKILELFAPQLASFHEESLANKFYYIVTIPTSTILRITSPVRDQSILLMLSEIEKSQSNPLFNGELDAIGEEIGKFDFELDRTLISIQTFVGLSFVNYIYLSGQSYGILWFLLGGLFHALLAYVVFLNYSTSNFSSSELFKLKVINRVASFAGFIVSVTWIAIFATEIIAILKSISIIYSLSDDILGVTVFALGNSIGDLISNFTIAKMGMPAMALGACLGGPLLSLCSLGMSGLIIIPYENPSSGFPLVFSRTLAITSTALVANIIFLLFIIPRNGWMLDKRTGYILLGNWFVATILCIISETFK